MPCRWRASAIGVPSRLGSRACEPGREMRFFYGDHREVHADAEHEQDHADLGQLSGELLVTHEPGGGRPMAIPAMR